MSTIVLRSVKGTPLTNTEVDSNFTNLNTDKLELGGTYSSGTANGVAYLNGSKVLTTGSALTFDGTNFGVGTASPSEKMEVYGGGFSVNSGAIKAVLSYSGGASVFGTTTNSDLAFLRANSEQMRLTSTGLGIGTSSPLAKLNVVTTGGKSTIAIGDTASSTYSQLLMYGGSGKYNWSLGAQYNVNNAFEITPSTTAGGTTFSTPAFVLDSSGNLGLGVTPSASTLPTFESEYGLISGKDEVNIIQSAYYGSGGFRYSKTEAAARYLMNSGIHSWHTAPSGTAGNAISFTQAMTLTAAGNLGLGTTSPTAISNYTAFEVNSSATGAIIDLAQNDVMRGRLVAVTSSFTLETSGSIPILFAPGGAERARITSGGDLLVGTTTSVGRLTLENSATTTEITLRSTGGVGTNNRARIIGGYEAGGSDYGGYLAFNTTSTSNINTERARIDASGNLLVGLTSGGKFSVSYSGNDTHFGLGANYDNYITAGSSGVTIFRNATTERARITSGGDLLVTCTSTPSSTVAGLQLKGAGGGNISSSGSSTDTYNHWIFKNGNDTVGSISTNGSATTYATSSDYRLKDNQQPLTGSGAFIDALKPKTWNWKADGSKGVGFIAHEVQAVSPGSVVGEKDAVDADGKPIMQAMEYGSAEFIANIIAELQSLRARVAALEAA